MEKRGTGGGGLAFGRWRLTSFQYGTVPSAGPGIPSPEILAKKLAF